MFDTSTSPEDLKDSWILTALWLAMLTFQVFVVLAVKTKRSLEAFC